LSGFSSRLWMKISSPSRNTSARNPSHLGSKIQSPSAGNSPTRFASIGRIGGFTGSSTPHGTTWRHLLIAVENEPCPLTLDYVRRFAVDQSLFASPKRKASTASLPLMATWHSLYRLTGSLRFHVFRRAPATLSRSQLRGNTTDLLQARSWLITKRDLRKHKGVSHY
jgi:hypothetical protein